MFVDRNELRELCGRKEDIGRLLDSDIIGEDTKQRLREELLWIEDELAIIYKSCLIGFIYLANMKL
jgi:hypothetical protein